MKLKQFTEKYWIYITFLILLIGRIIFITGSVDFFDSNEYISRVSDGTFFNVISSGHQPYHPLYLFFSYLTFHIATLFSYNNPAVALSLTSAIFGVLTVIITYYFSFSIFKNKHVAIISSIMLYLIPFFMRSNITVLVDPTGLFFLISAAYIYYLASENNYSLKLIFWAGICFGLALLTHTAFALWLPIFIGIYLNFLNKKNFVIYTSCSLLFLIGPITSVCAYIFLLINTGYSPSISSALNYLLLGNSGDKNPINLAIWLSKVWEVSTSPILFIGIIGLLLLIIQRKKVSILFIFWILPSFYISPYIYENLHGRTLMPLLVALAMLTAYALMQIKAKYLSYLLQIAIISQLAYLAYGVGIKHLYNLPPNETMAKWVKEKIPTDAYFIGTNTMRTWFGFFENYGRLGDVDNGTGIILENIRPFVNKNSVYIASDSLKFPFWRFDGRYFDIRSLDLRKEGTFTPSLGSQFLKKYKFDYFYGDNKINKYIYKISNMDQSKRIKHNLDQLDGQEAVIGRIIDKDKQLPISLALVQTNSNHQYVSPDDPLSGDLLYGLDKMITKNKTPLQWGYSDSDGIFILPQNIKPIDDLKIITNPSLTQLNPDYQFFTNSEKRYKFTDLQFTKNIKQDSLLKAISRHNNQSYIILKHSEKNDYDVAFFNYNAEITNTIEAEYLFPANGYIAKDDRASNKHVLKASNFDTEKFVTSGPYMKLYPGNYQLTMRYKINMPLTKEDVLSVDISSDAGSKNIAREKVDPNNNKSFQTTLVNFSLDEIERNVEIRVIYKGQPELSIDKFILKQTDA